jgi:RNA polymerase sigma-70 factor (ECF subfamily)
MVITDDRLTPSAALELLARARAGDAQAFSLLIEPLQTRLLRQATALAVDLSLAEDLASESLVEAWKSLSRYNGTCQLSTWLYSILLHRYEKSVRRTRSRPISLAWLPFSRAQELHEQHQSIPASEIQPGEATAQEEAFTRLRRCVELLPEKHRQVICLRFFEDASVADMAEVLNCSIGTVKSRLHHGLEKLRKMKMNLSDLKGDKQI